MTLDYRDLLQAWEIGWIVNITKNGLRGRKKNMLRTQKRIKPAVLKNQNMSTKTLSYKNQSLMLNTTKRLMVCRRRLELKKHLLREKHRLRVTKYLKSRRLI